MCHSLGCCWSRDQNRVRRTFLCFRVLSRTSTCQYVSCSLSRALTSSMHPRTIFRCLAGLAVVGCANPEQSVDKEEEHDDGPEHHTIVEEWDEVVPDQNVVWLEENAKSEGVITLSSGLQYKILASGPPTGQRPNASDPCTCHYEGATPAAPRLCLRRGLGPTGECPSQIHT